MKNRLKKRNKICFGADEDSAFLCQCPQQLTIIPCSFFIPTSRAPDLLSSDNSSMRKFGYIIWRSMWKKTNIRRSLVTKLPKTFVDLLTMAEKKPFAVGVVCCPYAFKVSKTRDLEICEEMKVIQRPRGSDEARGIPNLTGSVTFTWNMVIQPQNDGSWIRSWSALSKTIQNFELCWLGADHLDPRRGLERKKAGEVLQMGTPTARGRPDVATWRDWRRSSLGSTIYFGPEDLQGGVDTHNNALVIRAMIASMRWLVSLLTPIVRSMCFSRGSWIKMDLGEYRMEKIRKTRASSSLWWTPPISTL
ncbi:hypothetical protein F511_41141 [Dorcoceras hygrometricum]|uniref:Uncharacterized protein n=1 Tax=Dorcoceras hygrometricum TaxID=472368 RepID=A0A2Z7CFG5_9LAMI|nr:hypothetical protein F511_41141 [Dorcoceras hygrometricum]